MKPSAAMIPSSPLPLGLTEPDGLLHVQADGFWSLCGRRCKQIRPQPVAATWPRCPECQELEQAIRTSLVEGVAEVIVNHVVNHFMSRPLEERVRAYWLIRQGQPAPPSILAICATSPRARA